MVLLCSALLNVCFWLQESSQAVVNQLEQLQGKMDSLENECRVMRDRLEEEELNAQKVCTKG